MFRPFLHLLAALAVFTLAARADDFDSAGVKIHYEVQGQGEPVILIHGLMASARINWGGPGIISDLAPHYRVIALDCRGHGQSGKPTAEGSYGVKMVEDVVRLMDHLNLKSAHIAGYSMGGMISLKLAVLHPERVRSVILGGMGWMESGTRSQEVWAEGRKRDAAGANAALIHGIAEFAVTEAEVKAIKIPVAVIVGESDPCRRIYVAPLLRVRPDISEQIVAGAGHIRCVTEPAFKADLRTTLERFNSLQ